MNRTFKEKTFDVLGGIPDIVLKSIPDFMIPKNRMSREEYLSLLQFYFRQSWPTETRPFFTVDQTTPEYQISPIKSRDGRQVISYQSRYRPHNDMTAGDFYSHQENLQAYLIYWRSQKEGLKPLVFCVHGFMMGEPDRAARLFRVKKLLEMGLDVALFILPFHWRRKVPSGFSSILNPFDLPGTIERIGQSIHDLHSGLRIVKQLGYEKIGMIGASLGGYLSSIYSTLPEADPEFIFMVVPAVDLWDYLEPRSSGFPFDVDDEVLIGSRKALDLITPLTYVPKFPTDKMAMVMHTGDGICKPDYAQQLIKEWQLENAVQISGGHWLVADRKLRGRTWYGWLEKFGFVLQR